MFECPGANVPLEVIWRTVFGEKTSPSAEYYARHVLGEEDGVFNIETTYQTHNAKLSLVQEIWATTGETLVIQGRGKTCVLKLCKLIMCSMIMSHHPGGKIWVAWPEPGSLLLFASSRG